MNDRDYRPTTDASWNVPPLPGLVRVKLTTEGKPLDKMSAVVMNPKAVPADWDPEAPGLIRDRDAELWEESTDETIHDMRYGVPSGDTLSVGTIGWAYYYRGRWCLILAECR